MIRTRIAPSPTGYPHIGTIYQIILDKAYAEKHKGSFFIRIEDTDRTRFVEDAEQKLYEALDWFNISEDESTRKEESGEWKAERVKAGNYYGPYRQSERLAIYKKYIQQLIDSGHAYYCFCSSERLDEVRKQQQANKQVPRYDRHCRDLSVQSGKRKVESGESYVVRLKVPDSQTIVVEDAIRGKIEFPSNDVDDQVLIKSDGFPTYHFAVVVDDHLMETTHVVRGEEWLPSAPKHVLVYQYFGWQQPVWVHTPTLRNPDKTKLSKRQGHTNVSWYIEQGFLPEAVINFLSQLGWTHPEQKEIFSWQEFVQLFEFEDLSPAGPVFDETKLKWMNGKYIREHLSEAELIQRIKPYLKIKVTDQQLQDIIPYIKERFVVLSDINGLLEFLTPNLTVDVDLVKKQSKQEAHKIKELLEDIKAEISKPDYWQMDIKTMSTKMHESAVALKNSKYTDLNNREFFMTIRVATTGFQVSPPLFESIYVLGKEEVLKRVEQVIENL